MIVAQSTFDSQQMVSHGGANITVIGIRGDFDVCQKLVKTLMTRESASHRLLNEFGVTFNTANSINWGRILFQIVYHFHSYLALVQRGTIRTGDPVDVCKF
jgi:threonine synthase